MDKKIQYEPLFPNELNHLNKPYGQLLQKLNAIDYELDNAPKDKGPNPAPAPRGMRNITTDMREKRAEYLAKYRERHIQGFKKYAEKQIGVLDAKQRSVVSDRFTFETSRNAFKEYTKENLKDISAIDKGDKVSMDYMAAMHFNKYQVPDKSEAIEKENIDVWSDRYIKMLDGYREQQGIEINKEDVEPELS